LQARLGAQVGPAAAGAERCSGAGLDGGPEVTNVEQHVREIAERVAADLGLEVVEVELRGTGGKSRMLRVYIDRAVSGAEFRVSNSDGQADRREPNGDGISGVTHEDCVAFSNEFGTILDAEDAVPGSAYTLEVSSPGLDRKLVKPADYERFAGKLVRVTTREPIEGRRNFQGRLQGLQDGRVSLTLEEGKGKRTKEKGKREIAPAPSGPGIEIELENIEKANLTPEW
jgi:ribosome maturation factor RimP